MALLIIDDSTVFEYFCHKYKTSNKIKKRLKVISKNYEIFKNKKFYNKDFLKRLVYSLSKDNVVDLLL